MSKFFQVLDTKTSQILRTIDLLLVDFVFSTFNDCTTIPKHAMSNLIKSLESPFVGLNNSKQEDGEGG